MKQRIFSLVTLFLVAYATLQAAPVGTWKAHRAYYDITDVQQGGNLLYVLASKSLYTYNKNDQSLQLYDKTNGLSGADISFIAWSQSARRLIIVYTDGNIDLLSADGQVTNILGYYNANVTGDKTVYGVDINGKFAYLSTGFGVVKVNMSDAVIAETYNLGFRINYTYIAGGKFYAASDTQGLYAADLSSNLLDKALWSRVGDYTVRPKSLDATLLAQVKQLKPGGPKYNDFGFLVFKHGKLYSVPGYADNLPAVIQTFNGTDWTVTDEKPASLNHVFVNFEALSVDPNNENHVFACGQTGLYEYLDNKMVKEYSLHNSPLQTASTVGNNNLDYVVTTGLSHDKAGNLWVMNSISPSTSILQLKSDNTWNSFFHQELMVYDNRSWENMSGVMFDSRGLMWFVNNFYRVPALACYQTSTDAIKTYPTINNQDGMLLHVSYVRCVAEDLEKNIWIGTSVGPAYLSAAEIAEGGNTFTQVKVARNDGTNLASYLLSGVDILSMAVDGAGRKWFGTNGSGVYLISTDNQTEIKHFTAANSPLLSDIVQSIAINEVSGEVYFGTSKGLCSYQSDATKSADTMTDETVYAYPNPVRPDYTGPITVVGLTYDADVKIVSAAGYLVKQGRSNGGTFVWDGTGPNGKRVPSGIYMVQTATRDGDKGTVCKIAFVN
uniref:PorZ N-terminal beta-propeller domain-containing protein n=1 Tax=Prevotella sp. GTC17259 TaxID=3236795 RepID=A0AB33J581_9BACT